MIEERERYYLESYYSLNAKLNKYTDKRELKYIAGKYHQGDIQELIAFAVGEYIKTRYKEEATLDPELMRKLFKRIIEVINE